MKNCKKKYHNFLINFILFFILKKFFKKIYFIYKIHHIHNFISWRISTSKDNNLIFTNNFIQLYIFLRKI